MRRGWSSSGLLGSYRRELGWSDELPLAGTAAQTQHLSTREPLPIGGAAQGGSQ